MPQYVFAEIVWFLAPPMLGFGVQPPRVRGAARRKRGSPACTVPVVAAGEVAAPEAVPCTATNAAVTLFVFSKFALSTIPQVGAFTVPELDSAVPTVFSPYMQFVALLLRATATVETVTELTPKMRMKKVG